MTNHLINLSSICSSLKRIELPKLTKYEVSNPSIILKGKHLYTIYRGKNYNLQLNGYRSKQYSGHDVSFEDNQNYYAHISCSDELTLLDYGFLEDRHIRSNDFALNGLADIRIFNWRNELYALCVAKPKETVTCHQPLSSNWLSRLHEVFIKRKFRKKKTGQGGSTSAKMLLTKLVGQTLETVFLLPSREKVEKNWMPWVNNDRLYFIYHHNPFELLEFDGVGIVNSFMPKMDSRLKGISGSSVVVPFGVNFIGVTHKKFLGRLHDRGRNEPLTCYTHQVIIYGPNFEVLDISPDFTFEGERVEFCCGIVVTEDFVALSYGVWDVTAVVIKIDLKEFLKNLCLENWLHASFI